MSRRRDDLRALFAGGGGEPEAAPETKALVPRFLRPEPADPVPPPRASSGALKAMGLELDGLRQAAEEAERLKSQLRAGESVVELPPALIDAAFVRDRMPGPEARDAALEESLRDHGQQVPILVRPHPRDPGRYEAIYGHRRLAALARLGRPVKAVVRPLDDEALVIAQGQENNARADLSFIERARFAAALERRGFPRATVKAALDVHSADVTRYAAVIASIPDGLIEAIGPAPGVGRPRWQALAAALDAARGSQETALPAALVSLVSDPAFAAMESNARFAAVMRRLAPPQRRVEPPLPRWRDDAGGVAVERRDRAGARTEFSISGSAGPGFADFVARLMPTLLAEYAGRKPDDTHDGPDE